MTTSRDKILSHLRAAQPALETVEAVAEHTPVVPLMDLSPRELLDRFVEQAKLLSCVVHRPDSKADAIQVILELLGEQRHLSAWAFEHIPLPGLEEALSVHGIQVVANKDAAVQTGITGVDAALAATGSLVLMTGAGKARLPSLLPPVHIAVIHQDQILPDLEVWVARLRQDRLAALAETAGAMIISGPSRTADIAMQLILGMHGPKELHIIIIK